MDLAATDELEQSCGPQCLGELVQMLPSLSKDLDKPLDCS